MTQVSQQHIQQILVHYFCFIYGKLIKIYMDKTIDNFSNAKAIIENVPK